MFKFRLAENIFYRKKRGFDLQDYFRRQINKFKKEVAMDVHKVMFKALITFL